MINRRVTRTVFSSAETTDKTNTISASTLSLPMTTGQYFYVGFQGPFASRYFQLGTANTNPATLTVQFWNGSAWTSVDDLVDQTSGFTQSGFIHWENDGNWEKTTVAPISDVEMYWVRISTSANFSAGTTVQSVINLFCDDEMVRSYYPELITDTRYLPSGRTNFIEQYLAAKDLVVLRLKQRRLIDDESQIIDANEVGIAAVHAAAKIILAPIATSDEMRTRLQDASDEFDSEVAELAKAIDANKDGIVDFAERADFGEAVIVRR